MLKERCFKAAYYDQIRVEKNCLSMYNYFHNGPSAAAAAAAKKKQESSSGPSLNREDSVRFLVKGLLKGISEGYQCLDASRYVRFSISKASLNPFPLAILETRDR